MASSSRSAAFALLPVIFCVCRVLLPPVPSSSSSSSSSSMTTTMTRLVAVDAFSPRSTTARTTSGGGRPPRGNNSARGGGGDVWRGDTTNVVPTKTTTTFARRRRRQRRRLPPGDTTKDAVVDVPIAGEAEDEEVGGGEREDRAAMISVIGHPAAATATGTTTASSSPDDDERRCGAVRHVSIAISKADHDSTLALLGTIDWDMAKNTSRRNVIRRDDSNTPRNDRNRPYCTSFVMGRNMKDPAGGMSYWSTAYPEVYDELRNLIGRYDPNFAYTHITLNRNLRCKRHTDGGNAGPSYIIGFGDYAGGN